MPRSLWASGAPGELPRSERPDPGRPPPPPAASRRALMASTDLAGALAAVLGGQGLHAQGCDSGPPGEPLAPARLRKSVCYVVLAVFLNEQVSPPSAPCRRPTSRFCLKHFALHCQPARL